jgi:hypothetical protein
VPDVSKIDAACFVPVKAEVLTHDGLCLPYLRVDSECFVPVTAGYDSAFACFRPAIVQSCLCTVLYAVCQPLLSIDSDCLVPATPEGLFLLQRCFDSACFVICAAERCL